MSKRLHKLGKMNILRGKLRSDEIFCFGTNLYNIHILYSSNVINGLDNKRVIKCLFGAYFQFIQTLTLQWCRLVDELLLVQYGIRSFTVPPRLGVIVLIITQPSINGVIFYFLLYHESLNYWPVDKFDYWPTLYHGLVYCFVIKNKRALISMHDKDERTVSLWKEMLCNNGENEAWFGNFKLQLLRCLWPET